MTNDDDPIRPELAELRARVGATTDAARPEAVARRRKTGQRTVRENVADLVDAESFVEYGGLAVAAQRARMSIDELVAKSPADGLVAGLGTINAARFGEERARAMVLAYDYTVFAAIALVQQVEPTDGSKIVRARQHGATALAPPPARRQTPDTRRIRRIGRKRVL